jgi:predicted TIM-barrel fold metal-dependent hydrolase
MRIIDTHAHIFDTPAYVENLVKVMDDNNIERTCVSGLGKQFRCVDNQGIKEVLDKYPDRFIGAYYIRPGYNRIEEVQEAYNKGFKMLKITLPSKPYDDPSYFSLWEAAQDLKMPILFHTGVVTLLKPAKKEYISSWYMHPMRIEPIANSFPKLNMIIAHLGVHWNEDAAEVLRMKKNVYADLSGAPMGWRVRADAIGMDHYLWWKDAFKKIVFGTDVFYTQITQILREDMERLDMLNIDFETQKLIFSGNILEMLGER